MKAMKQLKKLAREEELEVIEYPDGRALVVGGIVNVQWWPESKNRTAYVDGSPKGIKFASAEHVISLAVNGY